MTKAQAEAKRANDRVLWSTVMFASAILLLTFLLFEGESAWLAIHNIFLGLFGVGAVLVPAILLYLSILISNDEERTTISGRLAQGIILVLICCAVIQIFFSDPIDPDITLGKLLTDLFENGKAMHGGGLFSAVVALPLLKLFGKTGAAIIVIILAFVFVMLLANKTVVDIFRTIKNVFAAADAARPEYEEVEDFVPPPGAKKQVRETKQAKAPAPKAQNGQKNYPNADVPEEAAEEKRREFNIDIPLPFGKKKAAEAQTAESVSRTAR